MTGQQFRELMERAGFRFQADLHKLAGVSVQMLGRYASTDEHRSDRRTCPSNLAMMLTCWSHLTPAQRDDIAGNPVGVPDNRVLGLTLAAWATLTTTQRAEAAAEVSDLYGAEGQAMSPKCYPAQKSDPRMGL